MGVIYKIISPSGRFYIGKTKRLKIRIWEYRWRSKKRKSIVHDSIKGYGWEAHKFEIIEEISDELLNEREIFWIKELNSFYLENPLGMNMTRGGDGNGVSWMHDTERRKKQSEIFKGSGGTFYGKKHTAENKKIISECMRKRNKEKGITVPKWGAEKGRLKVIKSVLLYDKNGYFLKEFPSYTDAGNFIGVKAGRVWESVSGERTHCNYHHFRIKTENYPLKIDVSAVKEKTIKRPIICFFGNNKIEYISSLEASLDLGIPKTTINRAAYYNKGKKIRSGHVFIYKDLVAEILKQTA